MTIRALRFLSWTKARRWFEILVVFVVTLEVAARVEDKLAWDAPLLGPYSHARLVVNDAPGFRNRPGYRFEKWSINSLGFRGPEITLEPAPEHLRVGVLGASETFGLFEREGWDYPSRLRAIADSLGSGGIEVVNLAVAGMGLPAMAGYYESLVKRISPDVVLIYPSPSFYLDVDPPAKPSEYRSDDEEAAHLGSTSGLALSLPESRLRWKVRNVLRQFLPAQLQESLHRRSIESARRSHGPEWVWVSVPRDRMGLFKSHLEDLVAVIQNDGAEVMLVTHTNRFMKPETEFTPEDWRHMMAILSYFPRATPEVMAGIDLAANEVIREVAEEWDVTVIDVVGRIPPEAEFFADYGHFTDAGADKMARILAAAVISAAEAPLHP